MRSCAWLICLVGCGRIGFDPSSGPTSDGAPLDGTPPDGEPLVSVDPRTLPPFGAPVLAPFSSGLSEDDVCLTRDQLEVFFESSRDGGSDLFTARRTSLTTPWSTPVRIAALDDAAAQEHPHVSADGLTLYYTAGDLAGADMWSTTRPDRASPFGPPTLLAGANSPTLDAFGSVDARGLILVFSSTRQATVDDGLYESQRSSLTQPWSVPVVITKLNTGRYERAPHLDDLGLVMYYDDGDLLFATRTSVSGGWSDPVNVTEINQAAVVDSDPWLSPDLRTLYFTSDRSGVKQIYIATR